MSICFISLLFSPKTLSQIPPQRAQQCCLLPAAVACCCLLSVPSNYLPLSWQMETKPTLLQHSERILNSCALLKIYSCNFNHTFMYRLDWWKNKLLLLLKLLLCRPSFFVQGGGVHSIFIYVVFIRKK